MAKKYYIGFLILVILSTSLYVMLPDKIRIDVQKTRTQYRVYENDSWILSATEYVNVWDGSKKMRAKNRSINWINNSGIITISREANYKDSISTYETYVFDSTKNDVELVPILHETICVNCVGKILQFEYKDITYSGETKVIFSPFSFGHNMKLTWQDGAYYSKVLTYKTVSPKIRIRYKPVKDRETFYVRLFDPLENSIIVGTKVVKELCNPVYQDIKETIPHYKTIKGKEFPNGTVVEDKQVLDYIETNVIGTEQIGCKKTGVVNVSGVIYQGDDSWCGLIGDKICCAHNKVGGQYASFWRTDESVAMYCEDLITGKETWTNMIGKKRADVIRLE